MTNEQMMKIVDTIMAAAKKSLVNRIANMNPVEAMKITAKELVDFGLPVEKAVVTVKALMIQIGRELDLPHPYSDAEIQKMMQIIMK